MKLYISLIIIQIFLSICTVFSQDYANVRIETEYGPIDIILYNETPKHRNNFLKLVKSGYYDGQLFHRVIEDFMIQAGDPNSTTASKGELLGSGGPGYTIYAELDNNHFHKRGALAAARKGDHVNPFKKSSGSQFYIIQGEVFTPDQLNAMVNSGRHKPFTIEEFETYTTIGGSPHLDRSYTVFGEVISGLEIVDKIASLPVDSNNRPVIDVSMSMSVISE